MKRKFLPIISLIIALSLLLTGCDFLAELMTGIKDDNTNTSYISLDDIPEFDGETPYVVINNNVPFFEDEDCSHSYEKYSELDALGRCGVALACLGRDIMPTEERESISHVIPSGWQSVKYDTVPGEYLYNRCHLIGFQLAGENDNEKNLITGTKHLNNEGMLPFENSVAEYVRESGNRVLYRVTPIYDGTDLVARGVLMEAKSVGDDAISLCIYLYNAQPGIVIDYKTGMSRLADDPIAALLTSGHEKLDILPANLSDTVDEVYAEYVGDAYSGALVISKVRGESGVITLATDVSEEGRVLAVTVISRVEKNWGSAMESFVSSLVGLDRVGLSSVTSSPANETASAAIRDGVAHALFAVERYTDIDENGEVFVANKSSKKFHLEDCSGASSMAEWNKLVYVGFAEDLIEAGYSPCGSCNPAG